MKKRNVIKEKENSLKFLINAIKTLSYELEEHDQSLVSSLGDYLTEDIATEWEPELVASYVNIALNELNMDKEAVNLLKIIDKRFEEASSKGSLFEEKIWTLDGLKDHPFWAEQRRLAKELLQELEKIQIS